MDNPILDPFSGPVGVALIIEELPGIDVPYRYFVSGFNIPLGAFEKQHFIHDDRPYSPDFADLEDAKDWCRRRELTFQIRPIRNY